MKSYTNLEQSKKLAEILPIESADMFYRTDGSVKLMWEHLKDIPVTTPCWSLSALLELIPNWTMDKTDKVNLTCNSYYHCESCYEDPIDAAFEMICWLKENEKI